MPQRQTRVVEGFRGLRRESALALESAWLRVLPRLTRDRLWVSVDGLRFYGSRAHARFLYKVLKGGYEPLSTSLFAGAIQPGMVALDLGAYLGWYTLLAARDVGPYGKVYAFEADPRTFRFLRHNVRLNGYGGRVATVPKAVSDEIGAMPFYLHAGLGWNSGLWKHEGAERAVTVDVTTVDATLGDQRVDVVKMDIEGAEIRALRGMKRVLSRSPDVVMLVEFNAKALAGAGGSLQGLLQELRELGFDTALLDDQTRTIRPVDDAARELDQQQRKGKMNFACWKGAAKPIAADRLASRSLLQK